MKPKKLKDNVKSFMMLADFYSGIGNRLQKDFKCAGCGNCCTKVHAITLAETDIPHLAEKLHMGVKAFEEAYVTKTPLGETRLKMDGKICPFYEDGCTVYEVRPKVCRAFPNSSRALAALSAERLLITGMVCQIPGASDVCPAFKTEDWTNFYTWLMSLPLESRKLTTIELANEGKQLFDGWFFDAKGKKKYIKRIVREWRNSE